MTVYNPFDFFIEEEAETFPFQYPEDIRDDLKIYMQPEPMTPALADYVASIDLTPLRTIDFIVGLNARLQQTVNYVIRMEPGVQTPEQTLQLALGSCRDSSWLLVQILRHLGLAARFVSGYLIQLAPDLKALDGPSGTEVDFTDLHAWCEVYIPGAGWVGLDPTSGLLTGESHIPLSATPHYRNAAPISGGLYGDANTTFEFDMKVARVAEHPRITKPFSEESWQALNALGEHVDTVLNASDVRLTMGGEPTFVSIDDFESEEWNTGAVGPTKRDKADQLIRRLRERFAPGGFLHYGQGKWYPGESLPRWTFSLYWRKDGKPIWHDPKLIAAEGQDTKVERQEAEALLTGIAAELEIEPDMIIPAFEDPAEWIIKEGSLPENVDPSNSKLEEPGRARPHRQGLRARADDADRLYPSCSGLERKGRGTPVGQREMAHASRQDLPHPRRFARSAFACRSEPCPTCRRRNIPTSIRPIHRSRASRLPDYSAPARALAEASRTASEPSQGRNEQNIAGSTGDIRGAVRTALSVEPRDGRLCVFMPPVERIEDYLDLIAAAEKAASDLGLPIHIEGYSPPQDERINVMRVAPDPGVIEVNIHPASNWADCVAITTAIYEEARLTRLGADKFMIDGRHTGTGGGNHVVVGGDNPNNSPFLRRPDLLKSLILHWQRHPSLSYLFSGMFIGPTSQAPRIDEARHDSSTRWRSPCRRCRCPVWRRGLCPGWSIACSATS